MDPNTHENAAGLDVEMAGGWSNLIASSLDEPPRAASSHQARPEPEPKRFASQAPAIHAGRSLGHKGSSLLRSAIALQEQEEKQRTQRHHTDLKTTSRGIYWARAARAQESNSKGTGPALAERRAQITDQLSLLQGRIPDIGTTLQYKMLSLARTLLKSSSRNQNHKAVRNIIFSRRRVGSLQSELQAAGAATVRSVGHEIVRRPWIFQRCAATLVNLTGMLQGVTLCVIAMLTTVPASNPPYIPWLFIKRRRYDETPSQITIQVHDERESGKTAKVFQTEFKMLALLQHSATGKFITLTWNGATWLSVVERTTADVILATQEDIEKNVPELDRMGEIFRMSLQMITTDRYAANFLAEAAFNDNHPRFTKTHKGCDIHDSASSLGKTFAHAEEHISGMIHGALAMLMGGSTRGFRRAVFTVISDRLEIVHGNPPQGHVARYRKEVLDMFIPVDGNFLRSKLRATTKRRFCLTAFCNGNILNRNTFEFYGSIGTDREAVLHYMSYYLVPALVPGKLPLFPRGRFTGHANTIAYLGILDSHHGLLLPSVQVWLGHTTKPSSSLVAMPELETNGWSFCEEEVRPPVILPVQAENAEAAAGDGSNDTRYGPTDNSITSWFE
jgi:hypothetical protein